MAPISAKDKESLLTLAQTTPIDIGKQIVEIGSAWGNGSTGTLLAHTIETKEHLYCIDWFKGINPIGFDKPMLDSFIETINFENFDDYVTVMISESSKASKFFEDTSMDLIFIDGGHTYTRVKVDIETWYPKVKPGGIISGHDCECLMKDLKNKDLAYSACDKDNNYTVEEGWIHYGVVRAVSELVPDAIVINGSVVWYFTKPE